jgi:hypothetical protein
LTLNVYDLIAPVALLTHRNGLKQRLILVILIRLLVISNGTSLNGIWLIPVVTHYVARNAAEPILQRSAQDAAMPSTRANSQPAGILGPVVTQMICGCPMLEIELYIILHMEPEGIEPSIPACKTSVFPLALRPPQSSISSREALVKDPDSAAVLAKVVVGRDGVGLFAFRTERNIRWVLNLDGVVNPLSQRIRRHLDLLSLAVGTERPQPRHSSAAGTVARTV